MASKRRVTVALVLVIGALTAGCATVSKTEIGTTIGAIAGGLVGSKVDDKNKGKWIALGAGAGALLGREIGKYLDEKDQARMAQAAREAAVTGSSQSWVNTESGTSGEARVVESEVKTEPAAIPVLKKRISKVPPLEIMGETFRVKTNSNLRGGPGTDYEIVGSLAANDVVNIVGKVKGADWYLVSHDGVGSGFVSAALVAAAANSIPSSSGTIAQADVSELEVETERTCRTIEQTVKLADGSSKSETVETCRGPNGWEVKA